MTNRQFPIIQKADLAWRDGLPVSSRYGDVYFSVEDGLKESLHVFLDGNRIAERFRALKTKGFYILETGFGTGLNALLSIECWLKEAPKDARLYYTSIEKHPLCKEDLTRALALWPALQEVRDALLEQYPPLVHGMHRLSLFEGRVELTLIFMDVVEALDALLLTSHPCYEKHYQRALVDAWYLDGFAPSKNADMWQPVLFERMAMLSRIGAGIASFTVARQVKDALTQNGFHIEKRRGFGKKRECLSGLYRPDDTTLATQRRYPKARTPWHRPLADQMSPKRLAIVGAGLSGAMLAYALRGRGLDIRVFEAGKSSASGGSGNPQAVLYPRFSAYRSPLVEWLLHAYLHAKNYYPKLMQRFAIPGALDGIVILDEHNDVDYQDGLQRAYIEANPELVAYFDAKKLSELTGLLLQKDGIWVPGAGWLDAGVLCERLLEASGAELLYNTAIKTLEYDYSNAEWQIESCWKADVVVLCNASAVVDFTQTAHLPMKAIAGQLSFIAPTEALQGLRVPLCGEGHLLPVYQERQALGATYHPKGGILDEGRDNKVNLAKLAKLGLIELSEEHIVGSWAAMRAATPDYLPLVGPVAIPESFKTRYARFSKNAKDWLPEAPLYHPSLYIMAGFGSRGLTSTPLAAEYLKNLILGEPSCLTNALEQAVSPQRFLYRALCRSAL